MSEPSYPFSRGAVYKCDDQGEKEAAGKLAGKRQGENNEAHNPFFQLIEKHAASQSSSLQDLQQELRSLKTLLQSRQQSSSYHSNSSSTTSAASVNPQNGTNGTNGSLSQTHEAANKLLEKKGKGIPAWQLPASNANTNANGNGSGSSTPANGGGSLSGSGNLDKDSVGLEGV